MTRISTALAFKLGVDAMLDQQNALADSQFKISTGKKVNTPADDPIGASRLLKLKQEEKTTNQYQENAGAADNKLAFTETALKNFNTRLFRAKELAIQAGNAALSDGDRNAVKAELSQILKDMVSIGNSKLGSDYMFSGFKNQVEPVVQLEDGTFEYRGDEGVQFIPIGPSADVQMTDTAKGIFFDVPAADATITTTNGLTSITSTAGGLVNSGAMNTLALAELKINGIDVEAAVADTVSTTDASGSAIAVAQAINKRSDKHNVIATANATTFSMTAVTTGGTLAAGELVLNGVNITGSTAGGISDFVSIINDQSSSTGVTASQSGADIVLTASDGRNIQLVTDGSATGVDSTSFVLTGAALDQVQRGTVTLTDHQSITLSGSSPSDAGFTAGTTANAGNSGTGVVSTPVLVNNNNNTSNNETYLIQFNNPATTFSVYAESAPTTPIQVYDSTNPDVPLLGPNITYIEGQSLIFNGIELTITGTPSANDSFTVGIEPVDTQDIFTSIRNLITSMNTLPKDSDQYSYQIGVALTNIDNTLDKVSETQAKIGARFNLIDQQVKGNDQFLFFAQQGISEIEDLDYYAAISDLTQKRFALDAAQRSFVRVQELSLFNFIR